MTAICGGGTSGPILLPELAATYSAGRLAQLLVKAGLSELSAWLPLVGLIPVVYTAFCAVDPPTMVALTQAESDALANNTFGTDFVNGLGKFKDVLLNLIWLDVCQCTSGTLAPPTVPPVDANTPVFIVPVSPATVPCATKSFSSLHTSGGGFVDVAYPSQGNPFATLIRARATITPVSGGGCSDSWTLFSTQPPETGGLLFNDTFTSPVGANTFDRSFVVRAGTRFWSLGHNATGPAGSSSTVDVTLELWCNGQVPGLTQTPCCPPDVTTQAYLDLILKQVNLIQRQAVPFGYISSTAHAGLSGAGSINISGLLGCKVDITTTPTALGREGTSPEELFGAGFITFGTPDGFPTSIRLAHNPQLMLPARCSAYTTLDYDLHPGVVVTITELVREP